MASRRVLPLPDTAVAFTPPIVTFVATIVPLGIAVPSGNASVSTPSAGIVTPGVIGIEYDAVLAAVSGVAVTVPIVTAVAAEAIVYLPDSIAPVSTDVAVVSV